MAKTRRKKEREPSSSDRLQETREALAVGDHVRARALADRATQDSSLSDAEREMAAEIARGTRVDAGALWVAVACLGLFLLVVLIAALKQP